MRARVIARLVNHKHARELAVACIGFLICAGVSAHGALRAIEAHPGTMATVAPPQTPADASAAAPAPGTTRSEEHKSELQSLMRIPYAVFCSKTKNKQQTTHHTSTTHNDIR